MQTRTLRLSDFGVRAATPDTPAAITGIAVPYGVDINYAGQVERFAADSIDAAAAVGVPLLYGHNYTDPDAWMGSITGAENTPGGLRVEAEVLDPNVARKLRASSALLGLSVGVEIGAATHEDDQSVTYTAAALHELSITPVPAYGADSTITEVRHQEEAMPDAPAAREVPDLAPILSRLDQIEARVSAPPATPPVPVHARRALADLVIRYGVDRTATGLATRADMTSGNNPGLTDVSRTSQELIDYFDATRYFLSHVASMPFPETGVTHRLPRKTQRTQVGTSAEKVAPPSRDVRTDLVDFTGVWYKGWLDISYELIRTASPDAVMVAVDDMLDEAALDSERRFVAAVETAATPIAAFDFTSWSSFIKGVRAAVRAVRDVAGNAAPKFALTPDTWDEVLAFTDFIGRRILSTVNPGNADGTASLLATELSIAGIMFFESPESTVDVAYNDASLMSSELPPLQLSADNPQLVGRDVAILGNIMAIPRIPAGIVSLSD